MDNYWPEVTTVPLLNEKMYFCHMYEGTWGPHMPITWSFVDINGTEKERKDFSFPYSTGKKICKV